MAKNLFKMKNLRKNESEATTYELEVAASCVQRNNESSTNSSRPPKGVRKNTH